MFRYASHRPVTLSLAQKMMEGRYFKSTSRKVYLSNESDRKRNKGMSVLAISYPVTQGAKQAIDRYPSIGKAFCLPDSGRSEFEIVRLLSNTHYGHIHQFLEFIDKWLDVSGPIGRKVLKVKHPFQLEQAAAELKTFVHLYERLGAAVQAVESPRDSVSPDVEVRFNAWTVRVEVYTPVDLIGFQLFKRYVPMVLKYLDVSCGYHLDVKTQPVHDMPGYDYATVYYPYTIPKENETHKWLAEFEEQAHQWLSKESPEQVFQMPGPGGKIDIVVKIAKLDDDPGNRQIKFIGATHSTDTKLFFEVGTVQDTAISQWGCKLKNKLRKEQCGEPSEGVLRMLVVNFAMADSGWPHFISGEKFGMRFREVIGRLNDGRHHYDVVLPAQLGYPCCFGQPIWINAYWEMNGGDFIAKAGLDRKCVPLPDSTPREIEDMLSVCDPEARVQTDDKGKEGGVPEPRSRP